MTIDNFTEMVEKKLNSLESDFQSLEALFAGRYNKTNNKIKIILGISVLSFIITIALIIV